MQPGFIRQERKPWCQEALYSSIAPVIGTCYDADTWELPGATSNPPYDIPILDYGCSWCQAKQGGGLAADTPLVREVGKRGEKVMCYTCLPAPALNRGGIQLDRASPVTCNHPLELGPDVCEVLGGQVPSEGLQK